MLYKIWNDSKFWNDKITNIGINCTYMTVGQRLKIFIEKTGLSQNKFCGLIGIGQNQMSLIANDKGELKHYSLIQLVTRFGINLNWLFTGKGEIYYSSPKIIAVNEPRTEYSRINYQQKYTEAMEKLSAANEKEVEYVRRIIHLESELKKHQEALKKTGLRRYGTKNVQIKK